MRRLFGAAALVLVRSLGALRRGRPPRQEVLRVLDELAVGSAPLVVSGLAFFGMVLVSIAWAQARRYTGNVSVVGPGYFDLLVREFVPMTVSMLLAARMGAATSAEVASMAVGEQLEALVMSGVSPLVELAVPRILAGVVAAFLLSLLGGVSAALAAAATASWGFGADGLAFVDPSLLSTSDIVCAALKALLFGLFIPCAALAAGFRAYGGAPAVGDAVTRGVVDACVGCLTIDFAVTAGFWAMGW